MQTTTKKVKEGTKGQKQIVTENEETLTFYRKMIFITLAIYVVGKVIFSSFTTADIVLTIFGLIVNTGCYQFMAHMGKPKYSESGQLIDSGIDLNIEDGVAEHLKDVIIITAALQVVSIYSNKVWWLWLLIPVSVGWLLWRNVLSPYFFQQAPSNPEMDEKKRKKLERQMRRQQSH